MSWLFRQIYHIFLASLKFLKYVIIVGRMFILAESSLSIIWLSNQGELTFLTKIGLQRFSTTSKISTTNPKSICIMGLLVIELIQIIIVVLWNLQLEVLCLAPQLKVQMLSLSQTCSDLYSLEHVKYVTLNSIIIGAILFPFFSFFI